MTFVPIPDGSLAQALVPNTSTAYVAIAIAVIGTIITYVKGGEANRFEGVPEGEKIAQRQKMIADIEKQYGEQ